MDTETITVRARAAVAGLNRGQVATLRRTRNVDALVARGLLEPYTGGVEQPDPTVADATVPGPTSGPSGPVSQHPGDDDPDAADVDDGDAPVELERGAGRQRGR